MRHLFVTNDFPPKTGGIESYLVSLCSGFDPDDVAVTRAIVQAGKLLDVEVLDHLVIGQGRGVSLKERGLGFA